MWLSFANVDHVHSVGWLQFNLMSSTTPLTGAALIAARAARKAARAEIMNQHVMDKGGHVGIEAPRKYKILVLHGYTQNGKHIP